MISVSCTCGRRFKAEEHHAGKRTRCPVCGQLLIIGHSATGGPSGVNDNGELPSWWFPTEPDPDMKPGPASPGRGGSNPDDIQTVILPPKSSSHVDIPPSSPPGDRSRRARLSLGVLAGVVLGVPIGLACFAWLRPDGKEGPRSRDLPPGTKAPGQKQDPRHGAAKADADDGSADGIEASGPGPPLGLLVPAYFYPAGEGLKSWERLIEAAGKVPIVAVANPGDGPGERVDPAYRLLTEDAASRGLRLIGYVATDYARRPPGQVEAEIDRWIKFYPRVRGFFFDQQSPLDREVEYYVALREHARRRMKDALIITNPGSICEKAYFARGVSDAICVFANPQGFRQFEPPAPLPPFGDTRIAALVTNILDEAAMRTVVRDAIAKGIRYLYVGDSPPAPNPYAHLPAYWDQLVKEVASRNEPSGRKQEIKPH